MGRKKTDDTPSRKDILKKHARSVGRQDGIIFSPADKLFNVHEIRLDTGIFALNLALKGGYPCGQNIMIYGEPNVGKDLTTNLCLAALQRNKGEEATAAFITNEGEFDKEFARLVGCKLDWSDGEINLWEEKNKTKLSLQEKKRRKSEGVGDIFFYSTEDAQSSMDLILQLTEAGVFDMIVLNSIDGLLLSEAAEGVEKDGIQGASAGRGGQRRAQLLSDFFRLKTHLMQTPLRIKKGRQVVEEKRRTVCFFVGQVRTESRGYVTVRKAKTGGWALQHYAGVILNMSRVYGEETYMGPADSRKADHVETSHLINYQLEKVKYGAADGRNVHVRYYKRDAEKKGGIFIPGGTVDESKAVRTALLDIGWLHQHGTRGYYLRIPGEEESFIKGGRKSVDLWFREHPQESRRIQTLLNEEFRGSQEEEKETTEDGADVGGEGGG